MENQTSLSRFEIGVWSMAIGLALGWFLTSRGQSHGSDRRVIGSPQVTLQVLHDTVYRTRPQIVVREAPAQVRVARTADGARAPQIVYVDSVSHDTLAAQPFTAQADTIIGRDTIEQRFDFPPPRLSLVLRQGPDSIISHREIVTVTQEVDRPRPWYEEPAKAILWMGVGYGIRALTAPSP